MLTRREERWGFPAKPALEAAKDGEPQQALLRRRYSVRLQIRGSLYRAGPGCVQIPESQGVDEPTRVVPMPPFSDPRLGAPWVQVGLASRTFWAKQITQITGNTGFQREFAVITARNMLFLGPKDRSTLVSCGFGG